MKSCDQSGGGGGQPLLCSLRPSNVSAFLHGILGLFFGLGCLLLPQFLGDLRLFLHLREALAAHLLSTQTFLCSELKCQTLIGQRLPTLILKVNREQHINRFQKNHPQLKNNQDIWMMIMILLVNSG